MKNIRLLGNVIICVIIATLLTCGICSFAYQSMTKLQSENSALYNSNLSGNQILLKISMNINAQSLSVANLLLYDKSTDLYSDTANLLLRAESDITTLFDEYEKLTVDSQAKTQFKSIKNNYIGGYCSAKAEIMSEVNSGKTINTDEKLEALNAWNDMLILKISDTSNRDVSIAGERISGLSSEIKKYTAGIFVCFVLFLIWNVIIVLYEYKKVVQPIKTLIAAADAISVGDLSITVDFNAKDEIGFLSNALKRMANGVNEQVKVLEQLAGGNLTVVPTLRSNNDSLGRALSKLRNEMMRVITDVITSSDMVAVNAREMFADSQKFALGSTKQAAAVEELSSTVFEISLNTKETAKMSQKAAELAERVRSNALESAELMSDLKTAVNEINLASRNINQIINLIDEIALQTNILALNAAVEAAGAGQFGKGFAVVAEEVRTLAAKSASAAKETEALIKNTLEKTELGAKMADDTSDALAEIVEGINESANLVSDIAHASDEQSIALAQVNIGIEQVVHVVNSNSSSAESSAVVSDSLIRQTEKLEKSIELFNIGFKTAYSLENEEFFKKRSESAKKAPAFDLASEPKIELNTTDFGKY